MNLKKVAILAGTYKQFESFVNQIRDSSYEFVYVGRPEAARGQDFDGFLTVGTFWERIDARKIYREFLTEKFTICGK